MLDHPSGGYCVHIAGLAEPQIGEMEPSPVEIAEYIEAPYLIRNTPKMQNFLSHQCLAAHAALCLPLSFIDGVEF